MRLQGRYWLEYDAVVLGMLAVGVALLMLLALSI
jgi:hypothetical protein